MSQQTYRDIKDEVLRRIRAREWGPGELIPGETDLAAEFGCARATISRALRELAADGLLERRRKAGTRVSLTPVRRATLDIPITRLEVEATGARYDHRILERQRRLPPAHLAVRMQTAPDQELVQLKSLHLADGRPYLFEDRWLNPATATGLSEARFDGQSANEWLVRNIPVSGGEISIHAANATPSEAAALDVADGTALLVVDRLTRSDLGIVTIVRLAYAPPYAIRTTI